MGFFSPSYSKSSTSVSTITNNIADSYNETFNSVQNLSGSKNVSIVLGPAGDAPPSVSTLVPIGVGLVILAAVVFFGKRLRI